jgi:hypothetical protein
VKGRELVGPAIQSSNCEEPGDVLDVCVRKRVSGDVGLLTAVGNFHAGIDIRLIHEGKEVTGIIDDLFFIWVREASADVS